MTLNHFIEETFRRKQKLYIAAIDYSKSFETIERGKMIQLLKKYGIDRRIINQIANVYLNYWTEIFLRYQIKEKININSGIRQGYTILSYLPIRL